jgi:hypothetical protein
MKPMEIRLETRGGNWVAVTSEGTRPATKTELYLWQELVRLRKDHPETFDMKGAKA